MMSDLLFRSVLIVDDEPSYRPMVQQFLVSFGYRCDTAEHAPAALERLNDQAYDLAVFDIRMPGMDGVQLMTEIHKDHPELDFILMTGHAADYSYSEIIETGAADFLTKPFEIGEFNAKVRRIEGERRITNLLRVSN
jgi:DNA-binding NtrC family response regulator